MKHLISFTLLFLLSSLTLCYCQKSNPTFKSTSFDKIIILAFRLPKPSKVTVQLPSIIGVPVNQDDYKYAATITKTEQTKFYGFFVSPFTVQGIDSACWNPDFAVYFIQKGKCVNYIEISVDCGNLKSLVSLPKTSFNNNNLPLKASSDFMAFIKSLSSKYKFPKELPY
ncbi:MAG: hypothetical protein IPN43_13805 [Chitinophagaceae bacterium]|nr:hypothetical protein [Chitinophagaceae bacterium]